MNYRKNGQLWGIHRVLDKGTCLPQSAQVLDVSLPLYDNELCVDVTALQIDSASFNQIKTEASQSSSDDSHLKKNIKATISEIIQKRGKMHNPVTNSGGVFLGTVNDIGEKHPYKKTLKIGDKVVSLISLSLTPLKISEISDVNLDSGQVFLKGLAFVFESGIISKLPDDLPENVAMAALDVCGAPAQIASLCQKGQTLLVIGLGKAGKSIVAYAEKMGLKLLGIDANSENVSWCQNNISGNFSTLDAANSVEIYNWVLENNHHQFVDCAVHATNVGNTEMSAILPVKNGGWALFFGMETSFGRVVLGAEGIAKDIQLLMGSGFKPGHDKLMIDLVRNHKALNQWFMENYL